MSDWAKDINKLAAIVVPIARELPAALASPDVTLAQVTRLYQSLERYAQATERMLANMEAGGADDAMMDAAEALNEMVSDLAAAVAQKMIDLRKR